MFEKTLTAFLILLPAALLLIHLRRYPEKNQPVRNFLLVVLTLFSVFFFTGYGAFHRLENQPGRVLFHWHEIFHYYLGSKYYPELGNSGLYEAVALADAESSDPMITVSRIRDLQHLNDSIPIEDARSRAGAIDRPRFTDERWREFKDDVEFLKSRAAPEWPDFAVYDAGFNPPPTWSAIGTPLANMLPLSLMLPYLDLGLLLACCVLVFRSFGALALSAFVIAFCTNFLSNYSWIMGSYLRFGWFFGLVLGISMLKDRRFFLSGIGIGLSAALLLFPVVFVFGFLATALIAIYLRRMSLRPMLLFAAGAGSIGFALFAASVLMFGLGAWQTFFERIVNHADTFFVWHIGYKKIVVWGSDVAHQNFWWADGLERFKEWNIKLRQRWHDALPYQLPFMLLLIALACWSSARTSLEEGALLIGGLLLFLFMIPANYYYGYLALVAPVILHRTSTDWRDHALIAAFFALLVGIYIAAGSSRDPIVQNYRANILVFAFFLLWIGLRLPMRGFGQWIMRGGSGLETAR